MIAILPDLNIVSLVRDFNRNGYIIRKRPVVHRTTNKSSPDVVDSLDAEGYRENVGMVIADSRGMVLLFKRYRQDAWQFPQGGVDPGEAVLDAMYRELEEEVGLGQDSVKLVGSTTGWLHYALPRRLLYHSSSRFVGQKQKWFLLRLLGGVESIRLNTHSNRNGGTADEFDAWRWVNFWYPLREIVGFKRGVYSAMLKELAPMLHRDLWNENWFRVCEDNRALVR